MYINIKLLDKEILNFEIRWRKLKNEHNHNDKFKKNKWEKWTNIFEYVNFEFCVCYQV